MQKFIIQGGTPLMGEIAISGAKNAALPILFATMLSENPIKLTNIPYLKDISTALAILAQLGAKINHQPHKITINNSSINCYKAPYELVKTMRASILTLGPLLARYKQASVALPGGCAIGSRPVNLHLDSLKIMGAEITVDNGYIEAKVKGRLQGAVIYMDNVSVTATENLMMAATLAQGTTVIANAAREPEVCDLANFLNTLGAKITGIYSNRLTILGVNQLSGGAYNIQPDRIETGTFLTAAAATKGKVRCTNTDPNCLEAVLYQLRQAGTQIYKGTDWVEIDSTNNQLQAITVETAVYPGFPTDMQAQIMALNAVSQGTGIIKETIFENRFMHVPELVRMGADLKLKGNSVICHEINYLTGAQVMATDLRASAGLVIASLAAQGETCIDRIYHIDRGYEQIEKKLTQLGASITRINK